MNNIGRLFQRFVQPKSSGNAGKKLFSLTQPRACHITPSNATFVNSFQKSWFSCLLVRSSEPRPLLALPPPVSSVQVAGFKVKFQLKRRCKDCYFVVRQRRKYVICPTHPRHKQMAPVKQPKENWILTHACQSKVRPW